MTANELFNLDIAMLTGIDDLEPNLSKAYADLASALYYKDETARRQIENNRQVYSGLINRDVACMCSVLCEHGRMACCSNSNYDRAKIILKKDKNGEIGILKHLARVANIVGIEAQEKVTFAKLKGDLNLYGLAETSEEDIYGADIIDPSELPEGAEEIFDKLTDDPNDEDDYIIDEIEDYEGPGVGGLKGVSSSFGPGMALGLDGEMGKGKEVGKSGGDGENGGEMSPELPGGSPQGENGVVREVEGEGVWGVREDPEAPQRVVENIGKNENGDEGKKSENSRDSGKGSKDKEVEDETSYDQSIHGSYYTTISKMLLEVWGDLYGKYVNGQEIVSGLLMPHKAFDDAEFASEQESMGIRASGLLKLTNKMSVTPDIFSKAIYQEYVSACKECGIRVVNRVGLDVNDIKEYKYNPVLQKAIISGSIDREAFKKGWKEYGNSLIKRFDSKIKALAVQKYETGRDDEIYNQLSGYVTSLMYVNYKDGLGTQLRVCCGDISRSKTEAVARKLRQRLINRERSNMSIAQGKMVVSQPTISASGRTFLMDIYVNIEGYQAVPQFMGELLYNMQEGSFKPSVNNMLIGTTLDNNLMTAPLSSGWLVPILAGSRSGKGVLTLNMLLNVIGTGTPLYYLDGKPDMASMLWNLCKANGINKSIIVDGIGYKGITDVDKAPYEAPYYEEVQRAIRSETANKVIVNNLGFMIYIKAMLVLILTIRYYTDLMDRKYGNVFVVFDEVFKVITTQGQQFIRSANAEIDKIKKSKPNTEGMTKEEKAEANKEIRRLAKLSTEVTKIINFVSGVMGDMIGNDIGVFGNGIKAVALSQPTGVQDYKVEGFQAASDFATSFLLRRGPKLFGRQKSYSGKYGMARGNDDVRFELMDRYFYFGQGDSSDSTTDSVEIFKPLLVLNDCDAKEITGKNSDGAFVDTMMQRVRKNANPDEFRNKYFIENPALGRTIGFKGALEQIGRLTGQDWRDCFRQSIERAYEISDAALRHFNVIGPESGTGLNSVYEFLVSCETKHLWSFSEIKVAKDAGKKLVESEDDYSRAAGDGDSDNERFGGNPFADISDAEAEQISRGVGSNKAEPMFVLDDEDDDVDQNDPLISRIGGTDLDWKPISVERPDERVDVSEFTHIDNPSKPWNPYDEPEVPEIEIADEPQVPEIDYEPGLSNGQYDDKVPQNGENFGNNGRNDDIDSDVIELENNRRSQDNLTTQFEVSPYNSEESYKVKGNYTFITSNAKAKRMGLNKNNSVILDIYANKAFGANNRLLNTIRGADFELNNRWKQILNQVARTQNPGTITRVIITNDLIRFNRMMIACYGLLGGQEGVEVCDIVNFSMLGKKFRNIRELTIDKEVYESAYTEFNGEPESGIFAVLPALVKLEITNGESKAVLTTRDKLNSKEVNERRQREQLARSIDAVADMSNPEIGKSSNMKKYRMQKKYSSFQGKLNGAVQKNLGKGTAGGLVVGSVAAVGAISFAVLGYGFRKLRGLFS